MKHEEGTLATDNVASLYFQRWLPSHDPRAALLLAHGLAEHSGRYAHLAKFFTDRGYAVYALDHVGHGRSGGKRCHVERFSEFIHGVDLLLGRLRKDFPETKGFIVGHSMGGLVAATWLTKSRPALAGAILSGAAVLPVVEPSRVQQILIRVLSRLLPRLRVLQLDASQVSRDPNVVARYRDDPLVYNGKVTARLAAELFAAMSELRAKLDAIDAPLLILHGARDGLTSPGGSTFLYEKISSSAKKLIIYDGLYHEIYNEPEQEQVMTDVANWLSAR